MDKKVDAIKSKADAWLTKEVSKVVHRIERIYVPAHSIEENPVIYQLRKLNGYVNEGKYFLNTTELEMFEQRSPKPPDYLFRKVDWELFENDLKFLLAGNESQDFLLPREVQEQIYVEKTIQQEKISKALKKLMQDKFKLRNLEPCLNGKWRKVAFPPRKYEMLDKGYAITGNIPAEEAAELEEQLVTPLNGYLGPAYNFDDNDLTQQWMVSFKDDSSAGASEDDVIRTQLESILDVMIDKVKDTVCNANKVLDYPPLSFSKDVKEVPVWGIDSYTRRNVELCIEDFIDKEKVSAKQIVYFIEKRLLPKINAQDLDKAHDMNNPLQSILNCDRSSELDKIYAEAVLKGVSMYGIESFKIHPKGTGVICINPNGIAAHVFVTEYLGEAYPPYRWCERLDVVDQAQKIYELKPTLPDFYNILLERPRYDPNGYGLLYVDASQKANLGSSCSHSCASNCTSSIVARDGKLVIALTTNRYVHYGEELCMDYTALTNSEVEWRAAVCLCGTTSCRGSFLQFATQDDLQQVLDQKCGPLWRFASLLRSCAGGALSQEDRKILDRHGMKGYAIGQSSPWWMKKYFADNLRFLEYERRALPCALMRPTSGIPYHYTFSNADLDARSVMEQRIQSLVCCASMIQQVLQRQKKKVNGESGILATYSATEGIKKAWNKLLRIPDLITEYILDPLNETVRKTTLASFLAKKKNGGKRKKVGQTQPGLSPEDLAKVDMKSFIDTKNASITKVRAVLDKINTLLNSTPIGMAVYKESCLTLREHIIEIESLSTNTARLSQLSDILAFWANTANFSFARVSFNCYLLLRP